MNWSDALLYLQKHKILADIVSNENGTSLTGGTKATVIEMPGTDLRIPGYEDAFSIVEDDKWGGWRFSTALHKRYLLFANFEDLLSAVRFTVDLLSPNLDLKEEDTHATRQMLSNRGYNVSFETEPHLHLYAQHRNVFSEERPNHFSIMTQGKFYTVKVDEYTVPIIKCSSTLEGAVRSGIDYVENGKQPHIKNVVD